MDITYDPPPPPSRQYSGAMMPSLSSLPPAFPPSSSAPPSGQPTVPPFLAKIRAHHLAARAASGTMSPPYDAPANASVTATGLVMSPPMAATPPSSTPAAGGVGGSQAYPQQAQAQGGLGMGAPPNALYLPPPAAPDVEEDLVPPENFAAVTQGVYRSGFPKKRNFKFLETLQLKTVLTLVLEDYPEANLQWCQDQDIQFMQFGIPGNKEPFDNIPEDVISSAVVAILDRRNHPLLIHCNKGKHRTGCLIGCIRRLQSWSMTSIFDEYRRFSAPKSRAVDQQFIDLFDLAPVWAEVMSPKGGGLANLPEWRMLALPLALACRKNDMEREKGERDERERRRREVVAGLLEPLPVELGIEVAAR